ncbi:MAG: alpha/beta hydrolase [Desulfuromonadales bacterium]|nr:MAG: alpha/beta hydrolase [Desulfuromonadales bacterium]
MPDRSAPEDRFFDHAPGVRIRYRITGHGPISVLFLHGFAAALTTWDDLVPLLPTERYTIHRLDLKGFGFSSKHRSGSYALEEQAAVVKAYLEAAGLHHVVLAGHSLGGGIALLVALNAIGRENHTLVSRLILIDCAAYPQRLPRFMRWLRVPLLARLGMALVPVRTVVRLTLDKVFHNKSAITPERIRRYETCFGRRGMARVLIRSARAIDPARYGAAAARYGEISMPTLIIWGSEDRIIRPSLGRRLQKEIPGARLTVIEGCGHNPHEERPVETSAAMVAFLEETHDLA